MRISSICRRGRNYRRDGRIRYGVSRLVRLRVVGLCYLVVRLLIGRCRVCIAARRINRGASRSGGGIMVGVVLLLLLWIVLACVVLLLLVLLMMLLMMLLMILLLGLLVLLLS